jgi:uncharacterized membrane protein
MELAQFVVQWVHVLLGILWFGYALSMYFLVSPALARLAESAQRDANLHVGELGAKVFPVVGILVLLLGFVRGTFLGPIDSVGDVFGTAYGLTWLVALLATVALFVTGARFLGPAVVGLKEAPDFAGAVARLRRIARFDLGLFIVIFTCMILMRFGL